MSKAPKIEFRMPQTQKQRLEIIAAEQGLSLGAFSRHIHVMYLRDPAAFEQTFLAVAESWNPEQPERRESDRRAV